MAKLKTEDFATPAYREMYAAILDLIIEDMPVSAATVARQCKVKQADIAACMEGADGSEAEYWADRIVRLRKLRSLQKVGEAAIKAAQSDPPDADEAIIRIEEMLASQGSAEDHATVGMDAGVDAALERIRRYIKDPDQLAGLATGWHKLDRILDGLRPGAVTSVYAKTGQFKSMFVQNVAWRLAHEGIAGAMFTTEMSRDQVMERFIQLESGRNFRRLKWDRVLFRHAEVIESAAADFRHYPIWLNDRSVLDVAFIRGFLARLKRAHGIEWAIVDLVNHVHSTRFRDSETKNEAFTMQQLKETAKDLGIHIIVTAHVSKPDRMMRGEAKTYIDPDDIKGSSAYSQDVDAAISLMLIHRIGILDPYLPMTREERIKAADAGELLMMQASITKNRYGAEANVMFGIDLNAGGRMSEMVAT